MLTNWASDWSVDDCCEIRIAHFIIRFRDVFRCFTVVIL